MIDARILVAALADPGSVEALDADGWTALIAMARAEQLIGTLAHRLDGLAVPDVVAAILADARDAAEQGRTHALWEAEMARRALAPLDCPVVLLKGTAYVAAGLAAGQGRAIGDLDILVPRDRLDAVEKALLHAGWEWVKPDPYDDEYYRRWMHELPPLIHRERDRMIDVHHTILPLTARPKVWPQDLIDFSQPLENGLRVLMPEHLVLHSAAHLLADGDLSGGLRNLWDIDRLCREFSAGEEDFYLSLVEEGWKHGLQTEVLLALRLANQIFGLPVLAYDEPSRTRYDEQWADKIFRTRLLARDHWGRPTRPLLRLAFYIRSHWLRMPPAMLARHLWIKARRGSAG